MWKKLIDINFDSEDREHTEEYKEVCSKYEQTMIGMIESNGGFRFPLDSLELIYLRATLEFYLKFPNLQELSNHCYNYTKTMVENVDSLLRNAGYSNYEIGTLETPKNIEVLKPIIAKVMEDKNMYNFDISPIEFGFLQGAIIMNLREGIASKWNDSILDQVANLLVKCNDKLAKLGFSEQEIFLMNNQLVEANKS